MAAWVKELFFHHAMRAATVVIPAVTSCSEGGQNLIGQRQQQDSSAGDGTSGNFVVQHKDALSPGYAGLKINRLRFVGSYSYVNQSRMGRAITRR